MRNPNDITHKLRGKVQEAAVIKRSVRRKKTPAERSQVAKVQVHCSFSKKLHNLKFTVCILTKLHLGFLYKTYDLASASTCKDSRIPFPHVLIDFFVACQAACSEFYNVRCAGWRGFSQWPH